MLVKVNPKSLFGTLMPPSPLARWGRVYPISPCSTRAKRRHVSTAGSLAPREAALHSAPLREPFLPLLAPLHAALPCGGGSSLHSSLCSRLRRSRLFSTQFYNRAKKIYPACSCSFSRLECFGSEIIHEQFHFETACRSAKGTHLSSVFRAG